MPISLKVSVFYNCLPLLLITLPSSDALLRNPITDRCLSVTERPDLSVQVSAVPCSSLSSSEGETLEENYLEILPVTLASPNENYIIQQHLNGQKYCISLIGTEGNIVPSKCRIPESILKIRQIRESMTRSKFEAPFQGPAFQIEQILTRMCLAVLPGTQQLRLTNCSDWDSFQRWVACRLPEICDVELIWSPARIRFPNARNSTSLPKTMASARMIISPKGQISSVLNSDKIEEVKKEVESGLDLIVKQTDTLRQRVMTSLDHLQESPSVSPSSSMARHMVVAVTQTPIITSTEDLLDKIDIRSAPKTRRTYRRRYWRYRD